MSFPVVKDYNILEKIGAGSYSTVYKAFKKDGSREVVALKCIEKTTLSKSAIDNLFTEIKLLKILKYEHIVEMKDFFWDERYIYIVMEYCDGGDLSTFIKKKSKLAENICRKFLQQLALALKYLRNHNVCHMDLKPQNLLLSKKPSLILKVGDFGFAQYLSCSEKKFSVRGSPLYMAPEILLCHKYDARVDLWSVGVIMYECLFGRAPYSSNSIQELSEKIKELKPIELPKGYHITAECKHLLLSLLKHDPDERISFEDFFSHEFLDLEHAPTEESFKKALALVQEAVKQDYEKRYVEAFHLYSESLRYFIPIITNETDLQKKETLRLRVNEYIKRAEKLKDMCMEKDATDCNEKDNLNPSSSFRRMNSSNFSFPELCILSKSTPGMRGALEIGEVAEQYLAEGKYSLALEKFQSSLKVLVPLYGKEPPGRRRELLGQQLDMWMKEAESTKGLLATKEMESNGPPTTTESHEHCSLQ